MMKKILILLCICFFSGHIVNAQSTRDNNLFRYANTKDCKRYIPIYGRPNNTLVLKVYPAQEYMGSWMKSSEYPSKTYVAAYDGNGLLASVDCENENERSVYNYSSNVLYCITRFDKNTGSRISTEYPNGPNSGKRGEKRITDNNIYFTVWFNTEKDNDGLWVYFSAIANNGNVYYIHKDRKYYSNSATLRSECGLSWRNHTSESDPYNPVAKMLTSNNYLAQAAFRLYSNGIPMEGVKKYADVVSYNNSLIIGKNYYEYTWSY